MKKGFTLIEIVIVLALATIIMVVVFIAVAGTQRAQRDNLRRDVANRAAAVIPTYRSNNNGNNPTTPDQLIDYVTNVSSQGITVDFNIANAAETCPVGPVGTQVLWLTESSGVVSTNICLETQTIPYTRSAG